MPSRTHSRHVTQPSGEVERHNCCFTVSHRVVTDTTLVKAQLHWKLHYWPYGDGGRRVDRGNVFRKNKLDWYRDPHPDPDLDPDTHGQRMRQKRRRASSVHP
ncbi:hypothetical protein PoB_000999800 [Plakobranchus ocellatus]|uniref:Uncharacterized protein n=1 Tax=Plakobranchus ocellatus TaxID=259542 RepID=A0AAV3YLT5_9GAST|nr:hypothetical protein PoB_000999800 [Plakobranchus ocellatus]